MKANSIDFGSIDQWNYWLILNHGGEAVGVEIERASNILSGLVIESFLNVADTSVMLCVGVVLGDVDLYPVARFVVFGSGLWDVLYRVRASPDGK